MLHPAVFYSWKEKFIEGGERALTHSKINGGGSRKPRMNASSN